VIARFFTVYGQGQPLDEGDALVIGKFIRAIETGQPLTIHGDGEQTRDFVNVQDVCSALIKMIDTIFVNQVYNVGSGESISINDLAKLFTNEGNIVHIEQPLGYARHTLSDISKSKNNLKWEPTMTIRDGIKYMLHTEWM